MKRLICAAAAVLVAGCGPDSRPPTEVTPHVTRHAAQELMQSPLHEKLKSIGFTSRTPVSRMADGSADTVQYSSSDSRKTVIQLRRDETSGWAWYTDHVVMSVLDKNGAAVATITCEKYPDKQTIVTYLLLLTEQAVFAVEDGRQPVDLSSSQTAFYTPQLNCRITSRAGAI